jgi:signal transduction histidine kinase
VRSAICTPILDSAGEVLGYFYIRNKQNCEGFTQADQDMLMALSPAASIAIQNARAYEQRLLAESELKEAYLQLRAVADNVQSAREEERTRIARELHDQLGQSLTALKLDLSMLNRRLLKKDSALGAEVNAFTTQIDTMIKIVRRIATELRPGMLDDLGLAASIEWQAHDFQRRTGVRCAVSVPEHDPPLSTAQSAALFRIFQEALTNITRHAEAQHVNVTLETANDALTLRVQDDGRGIQDGEIAGTRSLGLRGMRERVALLAGTFDIRGLPGEGTTVTVRIPVSIEVN